MNHQELKSEWRKEREYKHAQKMEALRIIGAVALIAVAFCGAMLAESTALASGLINY